MAEKKTFLEGIREALESELAADTTALVSMMRGDFEDGTVELQGQEATDYLKSTWLEGKGLRNPDEIDRLGAEQWWEQVFEHVATNVTPFGKEVFFAAIEANVDYVEALKMATVLGEIPVPPRPPMMAPPPVFMPDPMMPPPPMEMAPPVPMDPMMAPPPPELMPPPMPMPPMGGM